MQPRSQAGAGPAVIVKTPARLNDPPRPSGARLLDTMVMAARAAGEIVRRHYLSQTLEVRTKSAGGDFVSSADLEAEREILSLLRREFPDASIVAEESGGSRDAGTAFYVDPIDGTLNFVHGVPLFAVSIGCWVDGEPTAAAVLRPLGGDLYTAVRGAGAKKNDVPIAVSRTEALTDSLVATGWPYDHEHGARLLPVMDRLYGQAQQLRAIGCASLGFCLVAEGAFDGYWEQDLRPWDMAAGALIVREAGGTVTSQAGTALDLAQGDVAVSNGRIHSALVTALGFAK